MSTPPDDLPDDKFTPSTILDPYRAEIERLRGLLVKACCEWAGGYRVWEPRGGMEGSTRTIIRHIENTYGIRLRWNGETFEEDTTK